MEQVGNMISNEDWRVKALTKVKNVMGWVLKAANLPAPMWYPLLGFILLKGNYNSWVVTAVFAGIPIVYWVAHVSLKALNEPE